MTDYPTKEEWVAALRSGEYKQFNGALMRVDVYHDTQREIMLDKHNSFCCLGVYMSLQYKKGYDTIIGAHNMPLCEPSIKEHICTLIQMNDGDPAKDIKPKSFAEIADYIESLP